LQIPTTFCTIERVTYICLIWNSTSFHFRAKSSLLAGP
jgi:hypothetical protein